MKDFFKKLGNFVWSKAFAINFLVLIALYVGIYFGLQSWLKSTTNHGEEVRVPNLVGKNTNNLKALLAGSDLRYEVLDSIYKPEVVAGTILAQDPKPSAITGVNVKSGRKIRLRVSKRTMLVEMPDLVDKSQRFAEGVLRNREFGYTLEYKPSKEAHGAVLEQLYKGKKVAPGQKIPIGSKIKLVVGRNEVGVLLDLPNLSGMTIVEAKEAVEGMLNMEFMLGVCQGCVTSQDSSQARVFNQTPEYVDGATVESGGSIVVMARVEDEAPE
jgi:beta-lactam-binding protein with PASTA domain